MQATRNIALRIAALATGAAMLGGCVYDNYGYGMSNSYAGGYYDCDPYASWNSYYSCDAGHGFANFGYGGGWYDNYYYPGYGTYLFDRAGNRHSWNNRQRDYWARQRYAYLREHRRDQRDDRRDYRRDQRDRDQRDRDRNDRNDRDDWRARGERDRRDKSFAPSGKVDCRAKPRNQSEARARISAC